MNDSCCILNYFNAILTIFDLKLFIIFYIITLMFKSLRIAIFKVQSHQLLIVSLTFVKRLSKG